MNGRYEHLLRKAQDAARGDHSAWAVQSTGERVAVALVLNRADWLAEFGYTISGCFTCSGARSYAQRHECIGTGRWRVHQCHRERNSRPITFPGQAVPDLSAVHVVQPNPQEVI